MKVGFTYDLRDDYLAQGYSRDETAECDSPETIEAIASALGRMGFSVDRIGNIRALTERLAKGDRWDFVFNIAEGMHGSCRESQVPALLEACGIPCVFSSAFVLAVTLDKALTKTVLKEAGLATSPWRVVRTEGDIGLVDLPFPLFAKPLSEGSSKGVTSLSMIESREALGIACRRLLKEYSQPVLVESFLSGREFTVGVTGAGEGASLVGIMEIVLKGKNDPWGRTDLNKESDHLMPGSQVMPDDPVSRAAGALALKAWRVMDCRDGGRVDIRCDGTGTPCVMEINPIAGLRPGYSDLVILADRAGLSYNALIERIVNAFLERTGLDAGRRHEAA